MNNMKTKNAERLKKNERMREYYQENSKSIREKRKRRYQKTKEREKQYSREYYAKHKGRTRTK